MLDEAAASPAVGCQLDMGLGASVEPSMVAALYVEPEGCYVGLPGVDPWDEARDARNYAGPWPNVRLTAPPCERQRSDDERDRAGRPRCRGGSG